MDENTTREQKFVCLKKYAYEWRYSLNGYLCTMMPFLSVSMDARKQPLHKGSVRLMEGDLVYWLMASE